ncbi:unnamed protein product, partial [Schistosoma margrebowiei]
KCCQRVYGFAIVNSKHQYKTFTNFKKIISNPSIIFLTYFLKLVKKFVNHIWPVYNIREKLKTTNEEKSVQFCKDQHKPVHLDEQLVKCIYLFISFLSKNPSTH